MDAANIMLAQLNAQKPIKKKTSQEMPAPSPGIDRQRNIFLILIDKELDAIKNEFPDQGNEIVKMNFYSEAAVETGPMEAQLVTLGLRNEERLTTAEVLKAYKKKILLHASGKGGGKIENYTNAYVQV